MRTGNLSAASRKDSRATDSGTPSNSNKMLPGRTVATQNSGWPFPCPCAFPVDGSYRFVRENTDPKLALALHVTSERNTRGFQLRVRDPGAFERLQPEFAKIDPEIARSGSLAASPLGLSILHAFWHQRHKISP